MGEKLRIYNDAPMYYSLFINIVHEKITRFWSAENECILM